MINRVFQWYNATLQYNFHLLCKCVNAHGLKKQYRIIKLLKKNRLPFYRCTYIYFPRAIVKFQLPIQKQLYVTVITCLF